MSKLIAVLGSTGNQGGAVARACLKAGWSVRGITRNPTGGSAKALLNEGAEMVSADTEDLGSLVKAFEVNNAQSSSAPSNTDHPSQGVQAVFCVTNFWELLGRGLSANEAGEKEAAQAYNVALAASTTSTLEHYLFSTLPDASALTDGKFPVPHMNHKAAVDERIKKELPQVAAKTTFIWIGWYSANMAYVPFARPMEVPGSGKYVWMQPSRPDALLPVSGNLANNLGVFAVAALSNPNQTHGKYIDVRSNLMAFEEVLKVWSEVTGKEAEYVNIPMDTYNRLWGPGGVELSMQYRSGELWGDWERVKGNEMVQPEAIGIQKDQLVDLRGDLIKMKDSLL